MVSCFWIEWVDKVGSELNMKVGVMVAMAT